MLAPDRHPLQGTSLKAIAVVLSLLASLACADALFAQPPIRVGSKADTEGSLLGYMILLMLQKNGLPTESRIPLSSGKIVRTAITSGAIDIYPEYTGNAALFFDQESDPVWKSGHGGYQRAKALDASNNLVWLEPAPANNNWAIAVRSDVAKREKLTSLEELRQVGFGRRQGEAGRLLGVRGDHWRVASVPGSVRL